MDIDGGADILCDLNDGIPLEDNSAGVINASHVIEHLKDPIKTMREIHRVLADGGWAFIQVPSTDGRGAWQDPTHVSFWNKHSFWYYTRADKARYIRNSTIRFQEFRNEDTTWDDGVVVTDCWLAAIKSDARRPHPVTI
jgi:predicted SAM-dependent methyltransferase